jgi:hypothetical protein
MVVDAARLYAAARDAPPYQAADLQPSLPKIILSFFGFVRVFAGDAVPESRER